VFAKFIISSALSLSSFSSFPCTRRIDVGASFMVTQSAWTLFPHKGNSNNLSENQ
jgi:hypothetical protein